MQRYVWTCRECGEEVRIDWRYWAALVSYHSLLHRIERLIRSLDGRLRRLEAAVLRRSVLHREARPGTPSFAELTIVADGPGSPSLWKARGPLESEAPPARPSCTRRRRPGSTAASASEAAG